MDQMTYEWQHYYDRSGQPITFDRWAELFRDMEYRRIALDMRDDGAEVSTVWLGLDHSSGRGRPMIFETMIFPSNECWRYATEDGALAGHAEALANGSGRTVRSR